MAHVLAKQMQSGTRSCIWQASHVWCGVHRAQYNPAQPLHTTSLSLLQWVQMKASDVPLRVISALCPFDSCKVEPLETCKLSADFKYVVGDSAQLW